ncbi:transposase [Corynebacterium uberis]|nr:transposase [Corynebacterium uberis]
MTQHVPAEIADIRKLGPTLKRHYNDILAYFDHSKTSNGPTEAING